MALTLKETLAAASAIISKKAKENPSGGLKKGNALISFQDLSETLKNLENWCYNGEVDVVKVVRCKDCYNYRLYRQTNNPKDKGTMRCKLDKQRKAPEHYCAFAEEREDKLNGGTNKS